VRGLNDFEHHPPVAPLFWAFRMMVGVGLLMLAVSWIGAWQTPRDASPRPGWPRAGADDLLRLGRDAGRLVRHRDRPPALAGVRHVLTTADAASSVPAPMIGISLTLYLVLYAGLLLALRQRAVPPDAPARWRRTHRQTADTRKAVGAPDDLTHWLPLIFAALMGLAMLAYVVLDGFDLGVGILLRGADDAAQKDTMIASIGPFWDANETWLVLGVGMCCWSPSRWRTA
jgi:hypothetical protein